ncbi:MAG: DUF1566 domain-containing protein [SAR324 cluster bacterium]|nr:DUF1566 domain-containing protein [SAR324 cluster bacterium]
MKAIIQGLMLCGWIFIQGWNVHAAIPYTDNGNGTVTDSWTQLVWQKEDDDTTRTWEQALTYCEALVLGGQNDWRLPNIRELESLVDAATYSPAINSTYFPNTNSSNYWSSSSNANYSSDAWMVLFIGGSVGYGNKSGTYYVRCVRGGS